MKFSKIQISIFIALLFHFFGVIGILFSSNKEWFINNTPLNLILMTGLLFWNQQKPELRWFIFFLVCFFTGMITEMIGVNTSFLFGNYQYGNILGFKILGVPLLIGLNWFVVVYSCIVIIEQLHAWLKKRNSINGQPILPKQLENISIIFDGALLATFFDWVMEPIAVQLGFWHWSTTEIPMFNFFCWFIISSLLIAFSRKFNFLKQNEFAVHLLLIQTLFFLTLRIFI